MTDAPVPLPRRARPGPDDSGDRWAAAVPIRSRRQSGGVLVEDSAPAGAAPPWLRAPSPTRTRLAAVPDPPVPDPPAVPGPGPAGVVHRPPVLRARPPVVDGPHILGLARRTRGRWGSRLFTLSFVAVYALIFGHLVFRLVHG